MPESKKFNVKENLTEIERYRMVKRLWAVFQLNPTAYTGKEVIEFNSKKYLKIPNVLTILNVPGNRYHECEGCFFAGNPLCPCDCIDPNCVYMEVTDDNQTT